MQESRQKRVLIVQGQMKQYRVPFFEKLRVALRQDGIDLRVAYSEPAPSEKAKHDSFDLPTTYGVKVRAYWGLGNRIVWQPLLHEAVAADLVVVEQANKYALNYPLLGMSAMGLQKVAFWGHGRNRQSRRNGLSEWLKERMLNRVNWWFAYTAGTVDYLVQHDVPASKITNVHNAIDTTAFRQELASISEPELTSARRQLGIPEKAKVGLFCAGITREKRPEFLLDAALQIKNELPEFHLIAVGSGPEQVRFERAAGEHPWIHYLGSRFGRDKALYFKLAHVFLMPGLVGLAILDAFAAALPVLTTDIPIHSPEIEYLEPGGNGLITQADVSAYACAVIGLVTSQPSLRALGAGALNSAGKHSIEVMVNNFYRGTVQCLGLGS